MQKGFEKMIEKGIFFTNFRCASIKLIPKKSSGEKINNWHPINLLSNVYKVYSKAYSNRLKKNLDRCSSSSQKAYSSTKLIQKAIINVIAKSKDENMALALLAIDFAKAFDTVSHDYIIEILRFLNFSPYMIKIFKTMCNIKKACILTESGQPHFLTFFLGWHKATPLQVSSFSSHWNHCYGSWHFLLKNQKRSLILETQHQIHLLLRMSQSSLKAWQITLNRLN